MNDYTGHKSGDPMRAGTGGSKQKIAVGALLAGAMVWGLVWFPYRALQEAGIAGEFASAITYLLALAIACIGYRGKLSRMRPSRMLLLIGLTTGCCNVGFVLATIHGIVVRVVLLFYLAPVWTVVFAYLLLGERLSLRGGLFMLLAIAGAVVMLWNPVLGVPVPNDIWEWVGLAAGVLFALSNVLVRKAQDHAIEQRAFFVFAGCSLVACAACLFNVAAAPSITSFALTPVALLLLIGITIWAVNYAVQYGLGQVPANEAIVIYLSELVFAAMSSWVLAGESLHAREWAGGIMIVAASLLASRIRAPAERSNNGPVTQNS